MSRSATRRVCALCGRLFALVLPPGEAETERDRFCPECLGLPEPPAKTSRRDPAASRLRAALAAVLVQAEAPELALVHRWLDNWLGVGLLAAGLHRTGYDLDLRQYGDGHSILGGSAWEPMPWRAVPRAAWQAMGRAEGA